MATPTLPSTNIPWVDQPTGNPSQPFAQFGKFYLAPLNNVVSAANDKAAATLGVGVGELYLSSGKYRVRLS